MADYEAALVAHSEQQAQHSPEELAYHQGMADYEAALMAHAGE
jgi:hypothetical protein